MKRRLGGFWLTAIALWAGFGMASICGLRRFVAVLSGTSVGMDWPQAMALCILYIALYFGATLVAPILLLAGAIDRLLSRWVRS